MKINNAFYLLLTILFTSNVFAGDVNCYGLPREAVEKRIRYKQTPDGRNYKITTYERNIYIGLSVECRLRHDNNHVWCRKINPDEKDPKKNAIYIDPEIFKDLEEEWKWQQQQTKK